MTASNLPLPSVSSEPIPSPADEALNGRLESLLNEYGTLLHRAVARFCPDRLGLDVSDLEQEARIRVWRALKRDDGIAHPASYLYKVAASAAIDAIRRATARREVHVVSLESGREGRALRQPASTMPGPDQAVDREWATGKIRSALAQLATNRRRAVGLHLQGFTSVEIGEITGWSEAKSRNLTSRGMKDLRERLRGMGIDLEAD